MQTNYLLIHDKIARKDMVRKCNMLKVKVTMNKVQEDIDSFAFNLFLTASKSFA